jgi:hypothetical protein
MKPGIKPLYSHLKTSVFHILSASVRCAGDLVGLHTPENTSFLCFFVYVYLFIYLPIYLFIPSSYDEFHTFISQCDCTPLKWSYNSRKPYAYKLNVTKRVCESKAMTR